MQKYPKLEGFSDIKASDELKQRLYKATAEHIAHTGAASQRIIPVRFAVILVAILAVVLVGFTNADRIQRLFQMLFGGPVQLEQVDYSMIGESATDQGFKMEVVSAVRDSENLYLIAELTDLDGDRLSDDLYLENGAVDGIVKDLGENVASMSGIKTDLLEYNKDTKTAVFGVHATGTFASDEAAFTLNGFATDKTSVNVDASEISLYEIAQSSSNEFRTFDRSEFDFVAMSGGKAYRSVESRRSPYDEIEERLAFDSMEIHIPGYNRETVSNVAYKDGQLHILLKTLNSGIGNDAWITLQNTQTKEVLRPSYSLHYGIATALYQENVYSLDDLESLKDYMLHVEGDYYENAYQGDWQVRFAVPQEVTSVDVPITGPVTFDGKQITIKKVTVTPLSVVVLADDETRDYFDVTLIYKDGTRKPLTGTDRYTYENGDHEWHYTNAFLFQEIVSVEINGVVFDFPRELLLDSYADAEKV